MSDTITEPEPLPCKSAPPSPEERIARMRARVDAANRAADEAIGRLRKLHDWAATLSGNLARRLDGLRGLPVRSAESPSRTGDCYVTHHAPSSADQTGFAVHVGVGGTGYSLMVFTIGTSVEPMEVWIEHDGSRIDQDVAVDLAVAAVEAALVTPPVPSSWHPEDEAPFVFAPFIASLTALAATLFA